MTVARRSTTRDLWIYCINQLVEAMNRGREDVSRIVRFTAYDFLVSTDRDTSGRAYERMGEIFRAPQWDAD